jgi:hypothetical protein
MSIVLMGSTSGSCTLQEQAVAGTTTLTLPTTSGTVALTADIVAPTTAQVLTATAGATAGAVGSYAFLSDGLNSGNTSRPTTAFGSTRAGSNLYPTGLYSQLADFLPVQGTQNSVQSGTWRCMGNSFGQSASNVYCPQTLWLRIS